MLGIREVLPPVALTFVQIKCVNCWVAQFSRTFSGLHDQGYPFLLRSGVVRKSVVTLTSKRLTNEASQICIS
ncbi:hypothetical protein KDA_75490 [Dictyobacter alpinus]|uniref:Uncharacterized protein n=1 Tax=Dictyobacter alpinus TaxID=2014873 RepID=A0A402BL24_9CHLR|nr:hypothetical protein KDA_75490 [Dictyobacter alpinus]